MFFTISYKDALFHTVTFNVTIGINKALCIPKEKKKKGTQELLFAIEGVKWSHEHFFKNAS